MGAKGWEDAPERLTLPTAYHEAAAAIGWNAAIDFGMTVWEARKPPSRRAYNRHRDTRGVIYIPQTVGNRTGATLVALVGRENARRLVAALGGAHLEFGNIEPASIARRNRAIAAQVSEGWGVGAVACTFEMNPRHVRRICILHGVKSAAPLAETYSHRQKRITAAIQEINSGRAVEDVASDYGFTVEAVNTFIHEARDG